MKRFKINILEATIALAFSIMHQMHSRKSAAAVFRHS